MFYSESANTFSLDRSALPPDAIEISPEMLDSVLTKIRNESPVGVAIDAGQAPDAPVEPLPPPPPVQIFYSPGVGGFFTSAVHSVFPDDCVPISEAEHLELIEGQADGRRIVAGAGGKPELRDPPPLTVEQQVATYTREIEADVEAVARSRGYSSALSCVSYAASTEKAWQAEALAFIAWRDHVWKTAQSLLSAAKASGDVPTLDEIRAALPEIAWP